MDTSAPCVTELVGLNAWPAVQAAGLLPSEEQQVTGAAEVVPPLLPASRPYQTSPLPLLPIPVPASEPLRVGGVLWSD